MGIIQRLKHGWNAFADNKKNIEYSYEELGPASYGPSSTYSQRSTSAAFSSIKEKTIFTSIHTRISIDAAAADIFHVKNDADGRFLNIINSGLNDCLNVTTNIDQAATQFRQDIFMSLLEQGSIAIVPVDTSYDPTKSGSYDILSMRVGNIVEWYPKHVKVNLYNSKDGKREEIIVSKSVAAIVENPLYSVMNEPNSTYQRLVRKLSILDVIDEQSGSGKLDIIIQLPYVVKNEKKMAEAERRIEDIELQMKDSKYGIGYIDGSERITQLNRPSENNMLKQVEYLTNMLYGQLGITEAVLDGTAGEEVMLNYYNRTVKPLLKAVTEAMSRTFLTKTARTQGQSVQAFRDPFELMPISQVAALGDKLIRNEIMTSNEFRSKLAMRPSDDPNADKLRNPNMPVQEEFYEEEVEEDVEEEPSRLVDTPLSALRN